jgi:hypothetical protein
MEVPIGTAVVASLLLVVANVVTGLSQTVYDIFRIGGLALVIVGVLFAVTALVGYGLRRTGR